MINANKITKKFDYYTAIDSITCTIPKGCIYGMVGSNGAGKSTLLRVITGIYEPDYGTVTVDDEPVFENPAAKNKLAFVPDDLFFLPGATMARMASLYSAAYPNFDNKRFEFLADAFNLNTRLPLNTFSKGMKRQAAIILALSSKPDYLLMDETFDGLDPVMRNLVKSIICEDVIERKATAVLTSHSLRELEGTCDQLALLHKGKLILESDIEKLKTDLFKIQLALDYSYSKNELKGIDILSFDRHGSLSTIIARGDKEKTIAKLNSMNPVFIDVLPPSLEEVFAYEMESRGYTFQDVLEVHNNEK